MSCYWLSLTLPAVLLNIDKTVAGPVVTQPPGLLRKYTGDTVSLAWKFNQNFMSGGTLFGYNGLAIYKVDQHGNETTHPDYTRRVSFSRTDLSVTLSLLAVNINDAAHGNYTLEQFVIGDDDITDHKAEIFIYVLPVVHLTRLPSGETMENQTVTLTCDVQPQSVPSHHRRPIKYNWKRNGQSISMPLDRHSVHNISGGQELKVNPVHRSDISYQCVAQEQTSVLQAKSSLLSMDVYLPDTVVTRSPGLLRRYTGETASLSWLFNQTFYNGGTSVSYNALVIFQVDRHGTETIHPAYTGRVRFSRTEVGVTLDLLDVNINDAAHGNYTLEQSVIAQDDISNREAEIFIYGTPTISLTRLPSGDIIENQTVTFTCHVQPQSVPIHHRHPIEYIWRRNGQNISLSLDRHSVHNISGGQELRIDPVHRSDMSYQCVAQEQTSVLQAVSSLISIDVYYTPGTPVVSGVPPNPVIEGDSLTSITCSLPSGQEGNPAVYTYLWTNIHSSYSTETSDSKLSITKLNVTLHDGPWKCQVKNAAGGGSNTAFVLTVHASPLIQADLPEFAARIINESFLETCKFRGNPEVSIDWLYNGMSSLPGGMMTNTTAIPQGKYRVTTSTLTWSQASQDERKAASGLYRCHANNTISSISSRQMNFTSLYGPSNVAISPTGNYTALENETVALACEAECNPSCHYTWTLGANTIQIGEELHFDLIQKSDEGWYICTARNGRGQDNHHTYISVHYPPTRPTGFHAVRVTAVSITVEWMTGFDGGLPQTFTITYINIDIGDEGEMTDIPDECPSEGCSMQRKVKEGIADDADYELKITADNGKGQAMGDTITVSTPVRASLPQPPKISLGKTDAEITFSVIGQLTEVTVHHCVKDTDNCKDDNFPILNLEQNNQDSIRGQARDTKHNFSQTVDLVDPGAPGFVFTIVLYDGEDRIHDTKFIVIDRPVPNIGVIIGGVVGGLVLAALVLLLVLWRRGIIFQKEKEDNRQISQQVQEREYVNAAGPNAQTTFYNEIPADLNETSTYEGLMEANIVQEPSTYAGLALAKLNTFNTSNANLLGVINDGAFYRVSIVSVGSSPEDKLPKTFVTKATKDALMYPVHSKYLEGAAETMVKLVNCDNIINCLGVDSSTRGLLLEHVPLGTLRQYLTGLTDNTDMNSTRNHSKDLIHFIHQAANGAAAVAELKPETLFYCVSLDHVLLGKDLNVKLTGFSLAESVKAREVVEDENKVPRPLRWLSPEAIDLQHTTQSDVWGFSVLIWEILSLGASPFDEIDDADIRSYIGAGYRLTKPSACTDDMFDMMSECWELNASNRPTMTKVASQLHQMTVYQNV